MPDQPDRIIIDLDGTLCPVKDKNQAYSELVPYPSVVHAIRKWQSQGFKITIHTARNMRTYGGNLAAINKHTARMTMDWLDRHQIPYDEILFGKPWPGPGGFYVDDRCIRPREFVNSSPAMILDILATDRPSRTAAVQPPEVVITMAGEGSRFTQAGFAEPKFKIKAKGLPLFLWSMLSLTGFTKAGSRFIFIAQKAARAGDFIREQCRILGINHIEIIEIDRITDGQATTALLAKELWTPEAPLAIYNIDTYIEPGLMDPADAHGSGWIPCFNAPGDHWSFVKTGPEGAAEEVREKQRISDNCTVGLYWFSSCQLYERTYKAYYESSAARGTERYVAPLYNHLIRSGREVFISTIPRDSVHVLGTPDELKAFLR
jgi:capsule biosynthesis phosphatase